MANPLIRQANDLWQSLSRARWAPLPAETFKERMAKHPWESTDPGVRAAWERLTRPEHLPALEAWAERSATFNSAARRAAEVAVQAARARAQAGGAPSEPTPKPGSPDPG